MSRSWKIGRRSWARKVTRCACNCWRSLRSRKPNCANRPCGWPGNSARRRGRSWSAGCNGGRGLFLRTSWAERIASERHPRIETYRQLTVGKTSLWQEWRMGLPHGETLEAAALARLRATARALDSNLRRTGQVSRLAMRLYDGLKRAQAAPIFAESHLRKVMRAAARLHGIGSGLDSNAPQRAARDFLRKLPAPAGWSEEEWFLLINVVRYHRGEQPDTQQKAFARLSEADQQAICAMAGVLRLARALRKCGCQTPVGLR